VTDCAIKIAEAMGLPPKELDIMRRGGLLHDIGKIGTPAEILDKPGKLTDEELKEMREHVNIGAHPGAHPWTGRFDANRPATSRGKRASIVISVVTGDDQLPRSFRSRHRCAPHIDMLAPLLEVIPLQLLAYHIASAAAAT